MDPRIRLHGVSADLLGQLTASFSDHVKWLESQLEDAGSRRRAGYSQGHAQRPTSQDKTPWQNLLKSPARQRIADKTNTARPTGANHLSSSSIAAPSSNIFGSPRALPQNKQQQQRPTASSSMFRSPGKVGLNAAAKSPVQQQSRPLYLEESDKENSLAASTAQSTTTAASTASNKPKSGSGSSSLNASHGTTLSSSIRSPGRAVLGTSTSRQQQPQSPAQNARQAQQVASPTPRPPSHIKSPVNNQNRHAKPVSVSQTPVKVVDDVFMMNEGKQAFGDGVQQTKGTGVEEQEDDEDDDDEVADILLGYAKTPAQVGKTVQASSAASAKPTPSVPVTLSALHTSPPRPPKSPARPSPTQASAQSPSAAVSPISSKLPVVAPSSVAHASRAQAPASPRPAPRNMSNLASIASVLGSPSKPTQHQQTMNSPQISASVIQPARALPIYSRPASPAHGASPSRVPVPSSFHSSHKSPPQASSSTSASTTTAPRVRSPLMSDKISYFQSQSQKDLAKPLLSPPAPPVRASSRLAAMSSPPVSPRLGSPATLQGQVGNRQIVPPSSPRLVGGAAGMPKSPRMQQVRSTTQQVEEDINKEKTGPTPIEPMEEVARPTSPAPPSTIKSPKRPQLSPVQSSTRSIPLSAAKTIVSPTRKPQQQQEKETFKSPADRTKTALPSPPPAKSPLRAQLAEAAKLAIEAAATKEKEEKEVELSPPSVFRAKTVVKAKDFAEVEPEPLMKDHEAEVKEKEQERESNLQSEVEVPIKEAPLPAQTPAPSTLRSAPSSGSGGETTVRPTATASASYQLGQSSSANIPPSPVFSSFLSNPNRTSALSFVGLPGRFLGGGGGQSGHSREKSLGVGLGLGKSLSAANAARLLQQQESDSQGSSSSNGQGQSFHSALSGGVGKKRLSSAVTDQTDSQGSTASSSKLARTESVATASSSRTSISYAPTTTQAPAPASKEEATKAKLDMLRSRISNFKGVAGTNGARISSISSAQSFTAARASTIPAVSGSYALGDEHTGLFSPPADTASVPSFTSIAPKEVAQEFPAPQTHSAASAFSNAIASFVPAPSFSASFANLFGASLSKPLPPMSSPPKEKDSTTLPKPATAGVYPSLPSMTNFAVPSSPMKEKRNLSVEPGDEDMEELAEVPRPPSDQAKERSRRSSASSVHDIVEAFEARTAAAVQEQERQASTSPVQQRRKSSITQTFALPASKPAVPSAPVYRSTTPPFSPPAVQTARHSSIASTRASVSFIGGDMAPMGAGNTGELAIEDPDVEPIARASSVGTEVTETADEEMADDEDEDEELETQATTVSSQQSQHKSSQAAAEQDPESEADREHADETHTQDKATMKAFKPSLNASTLAKSTTASTFKPTRPVIEVVEPVRVTKPAQHRPLSRAPSVSSLAPSRASTISVASTASYNPNKSTNASSLSKKTGLASSVSGKPEVKSLQVAAAAAKKEQAEKERRAAQKSDRDQKRASVIATKRDDQADGDKKRKERDEQSQSQSQSSQSTLATAKGKAPMVKPKTTTAASKADDEPAKKRKMEVEVVVTKTAVKKTTVVRPAQPKASASNGLASSSNRPPAPSSSQPSAHSKALAASASMIGVIKQASSSQPSRPLQASTSRAPLQPAKTVQQQALLNQHQQAMSALGKSQVSRPVQQVSSKPLPPVEPEPEPFELPEVDSEYSDSDEETQAKKAAARPDWTQSPALRQALSVQATFDPDDLFGEIPALRMEEMFQHKSTAARLRFRTSSAHWSGPDALSKYEEQEYARRMGFTSAQR